MRGRVAILGAAVALLAAACGGDDPGTADDPPPVLPVESILAGDIDLGYTDRGALTFTVETDIPVVCSIAYGQDADLGLIGTDLDMGGTAHADHQVLLEPGVFDVGDTVTFQLQGADADGNLYVSDLMTATVPEAPDPADPRAAAEGRDNIATQATVAEVSSEFSESFAAENAIDGDPATEWSTDGDGDDAAITLDLGEPTELSGFGYWTRSMGDGSAIVESVTVEVDGSEVGTFDVGRDLTVFDAEVTGQRVTFRAASTTGGNTGAIEVEVYAG